MRLSPFNFLPPRAEYLSKVRQAFKSKKQLSQGELLVATGLTKTQLLCSLEALIMDGEIEKNLETKQFELLTSSSEAVPARS